MSKYAENTSVSVARSKAEIEDIIIRYGATGFASGWKNESATIGFQMNSRAIRFILPLPNREEFKMQTKWGKARKVSDDEANKSWEQACRQKWRALALCIKAKLEAVESGITTFEHEFLAHIVSKNGQSIGDILIPQLSDVVRKGPMPLLLE